MFHVASATFVKEETWFIKRDKHDPDKMVYVYAGSGLPQGLFFSENKLLPLKVGLKRVLVNILNGSKSWFWGLKVAQNASKATFYPLLNPSWDWDIDKAHLQPGLT